MGQEIQVRLGYCRRGIVYFSLGCLYLNCVLLTGQVFWTGPNRWPNEAFAEGAPVYRCKRRKETEWQTEHLHGFKRHADDQYRFMTLPHDCLTSGFSVRVDLDWVNFPFSNNRSCYELYIKNVTPLLRVWMWLKCCWHHDSENLHKQTDKTRRQTFSKIQVSTHFHALLFDCIKVIRFFFHYTTTVLLSFTCVIMLPLEAYLVSVVAACPLKKRKASGWCVRERCFLNLYMVSHLYYMWVIKCK